jgi:adenine-specific DNA-methyltransferase
VLVIWCRLADEPGQDNLEKQKVPDDTWKARLIEEDFQRLMFETENA